MARSWVVGLYRYMIGASGVAAEGGKSGIAPRTIDWAKNGAATSKPHLSNWRRAAKESRRLGSSWSAAEMGGRALDSPKTNGPRDRATCCLLIRGAAMRLCFPELERMASFKARIPFARLHAANHAWRDTPHSDSASAPGTSIRAFFPAEERVSVLAESIAPPEIIAGCDKNWREP
jgi:hypothetical protein